MLYEVITQVQLRTHKTTAVADVIADARRYAEANFPEGS